MRFVLDANVALTWFLDEEPEQVAYAASVLQLLPSSVCVVPALWHYEVAGRLLRARRNSRVNFGAARLTAALAALDAFALETHQIALEVTRLVELAQRYYLTPYDAVYLQLAKALGLPLASFDGGMCSACKSHGVKLLTF